MSEEDILTIKEAKENGMIPSEYHSSIIDNCYSCGGPIYTTRNLKKQFCGNLRCNLKVEGRMIKMLNNFGIIGVSRAYAEKFLKSNDLHSHLYIFLASLEEMQRTGYLSKSCDLFRDIERIKSYKYTFAEVLSKMALPGLDETAITVFRDFYNIQSFYECLNILNMDVYSFLIRIPGIGPKKAANIEKVLKDFDVEIQSIPGIFKLRMPGKDHIKLVITGELHRFVMDKATYIRYLNRIFEGYLSFEWTPEAVVSADFVITDNKYLPTTTISDSGEVCLNEELYDYKTVKAMPEMTRKHRKAIEVSKKIDRDYIMTAEELVLYFKEKVERGEYS